MIFNNQKLNKKFSREIKALESLSNPKDFLNQSELESIKQKVLGGLSARPEPASAWYLWRQRAASFGRYAVLILVGLSLVGGTAFASNNAIPGDLLYPVKIAGEKVQLSLATSDESKVSLEAEFAQRRLDELQKLSAKTQIKASVANNPGLETGNTLPVSTTSTGTIITAIRPAINATSMQALGMPTSTPLGLGMDSEDRQLQAQAKQEASLEVKNALTNLRRIHLQLQAKGNKKDAASVQASILSLQAGARAENLDSDGDNDSTSSPANSAVQQGSGQAASTTQTGLPATTTKPYLPIRLRRNGRKGE